MRMSTVRVLLAALCVLLVGSALAAGISPAHAAPKDVVTVTNPGTQTDPGGAVVDLPIQAKDTSALPLVFSAAVLPPGLTIDAATGVISGTITGQFNGNVTVKATDGVATGQATFTWTAGNKVTVKAVAKEQSWVGVPVSVQVTATDSGGAAVTYSAKGLPAGLSINPGTGVISGAPQRITAAPVAVTVTATDGTGAAGSAIIQWAVGWAVIIPNPGKVTATVGKAINVPISHTDVFGAGTRVTFSATGLPSGLTLRPNPALVYGWPTAAGSYRVTIHAKDAHGGLSTMTFPLVVRPAVGGPAGQIRLALDGKCLTDPGNRTGNGTHVTITGCQAGSAEHWTIASDGTIRVHNHCLDIAGRGSAAGQQVQLWQCDGAPREIWMQGTAGELVNPASGLCLTDPGSSTKNGTVPKMGACRIKRSESWTLPAQPVLAAVQGKCADDLHDVGTNGNPVDMYSCNGTPPQAWTFEPDGSIHSAAYGNKCVTVRGALGRIGTKIQLWACAAGNKSQHWAVVRTGGLSAELTLGGVCLAIPGMKAADGSQLVTAPCSAADPRVPWHVW